jgi:hypothetical protein
MQPPSKLGFGSLDLGQDSVRIVTITNTGAATLNFSDYNIIPSNTETAAEDFRIVSKPSVIAVGKTGEIKISFNPKSIGNKAATFWMANNSDKYPEMSLLLSGTATFKEFAELNANKSSLEFDTTYVGDTKQLNLQINNIGNVNVTIDSVAALPLNSYTSADEFYVSSSVTLPYTLAENKSVVLPIVFAPKTHNLTKEATLVIHNSGVTSEINVDLKAIGLLTSIGAIQDFNIFSQVSPTPTSDFCYSTIYIDSPQHYSVELINSVGEKIGIVTVGFAEGEIPIEINVTKLPSGSYFLLLKLSDNTYYNSFNVTR